MKFHVPDGATPIDDTTDLLVPGITTIQNLNAVEAENILEALGQHLSARKNADGLWLDELFLRRVHRDMFAKVWRWAGRYRDHELNIGVPAHRVREEIGKLVGDVHFWMSLPLERMTTLERAVRIHHRLSWIHPFLNGNGRYARFVADIYLFSQHVSLPDWPQDLGIDGETRRLYLQALKNADQGQFEPLITFIGALTRKK